MKGWVQWAWARVSSQSTLVGQPMRAVLHRASVAAAVAAAAAWAVLLPWSHHRGQVQLLLLLLAAGRPVLASSWAVRPIEAVAAAALDAAAAGTAPDTAAAADTAGLQTSVPAGRQRGPQGTEHTCPAAAAARRQAAAGAGIHSPATSHVKYIHYYFNYSRK